MTNTAAARGPSRIRRMVHLPGDGAMWVMVIGDLFIFGAYFIIFMVYRAMKPADVPGVATAPEHHHRCRQYPGVCLPVRGSSHAVCSAHAPARVTVRCG